MKKSGLLRPLLTAALLLLCLLYTSDDAEEAFFIPFRAFLECIGLG